MVNINIDIISDMTCVWCYIGKRTLSRAISLYQKTYPNGKNDIFTITWRPYYLNPDQFNGVSVDKAELTKTRLASWSPEKVAAATNRVNQVGRSVGINFSFGGKIGSTRDAHRLVHLCQTGEADAKVQDALVEGIFEAFHEKELDISDGDVLKKIAVNAGIGEIMDDEAAKNRAVTAAGVPFFIVQGIHHIDGAQDLQEFVKAFIMVREAEEGSDQVLE